VFPACSRLSSRNIGMRCWLWTWRMASSATWHGNRVSLRKMPPSGYIAPGRLCGVGWNRRAGLVRSMVASTATVRRGLARTASLPPHEMGLFAPFPCRNETVRIQAGIRQPLRMSIIKATIWITGCTLSFLLAVSAGSFWFRLKRPVRPQGQNGLGLKLPPLALGVIVAALMWCASSATPAFDFRIPASLLSAASLALLGAVTCLAGVVSFRRAKTTVNPMRPDSTSSLVVSGIYKYTRNPMYLGFLLVLLGWAIFLSNLAAFALLPAFVVYMNHFQIGPEERALGSLFAQEYRAYHARVRRWI